MKKLPITAAIRGYLAKFAEGVDENAISVYEAIAINTLPVKKAGLFNGAVLTESTLREMVAFVQGGGNVPMHQLHDQSYALPVGKQIHAELHEGAAGPEVRILFYVDNEHEKIVSGLETSTIDEVSIGFQAKKMLCSDCGWDYAGADATMENFWNLECANGHAIGVDGVHLNLSGLAGWYETSVVSRGAAQGAKILGKSKSILGETEYNRLAATGIDPGLKLLQASATPATPPEPKMDLEKLIAQLGLTTTNLGLRDAELTGVKAAVVDLTTKLTAAETAKTTAETALAAKVAEFDAFKILPTTTEGVKLKEDAEKARKVLLSHADRLAIAAGGVALAAESTIDVIEASMKDSTTKLSLLPIGGVAQASGSGSGNSAATASYAASAFKTR